MTALLALPPCHAGTALRSDIDSVPRRVLAEHLNQHARRILARQPQLVSDRVGFLLSHPDAIARMAEHSYWHSNGFAKVRVVRGRHFGVRLHIWPAGRDRLGDVDPHRHRWRFASWIAAGEGVDETTFEVLPPHDSGGEAVEYTRYEYGRGTVAGQLREAGPARLRAIGTVRHSPGEVYDCPLRTVHTVAPAGDGFVATVVLQGPPLVETAHVYGRAGRPAETTEEPISARLLRDLLEEVAAAVRRPAGKSAVNDVS